jgi:magnesium transporter
MLINCAAYERGRKLADIGLGDIHIYLARADCFVWVALRDATQSELATLQEQFGLHQLAIEDATHDHAAVARPKVEEYGDALFVMMNTVELTPTDEIRLGELGAFVGRNYVLSVRRRSERGLQEVRARTEREPELLRHGPGYVLYALMDAVVDRYFPTFMTTWCASTSRSTPRATPSAPRSRSRSPWWPPARARSCGASPPTPRWWRCRP